MKKVYIQKAIPLSLASVNFAKIVLLPVVIAAFIFPFFRSQASAAEAGSLAGQPLSEYRSRRQSLIERVKDGVIVLVGAREEDLGEVGRFRQKNDFMYVTGVETPDAYLLLTPLKLIPEKTAQETVFIPARNLMKERWTGPQLGPGREAEEKFGVREVASAATFKERLTAILSAPPFKVASGTPQAKLYTIMPAGTNALTVREQEFVQMVRQIAPHVQIVDVSPLIAELRKIKSPAEIALLQKAIDITGEAHRDLMQTVKPDIFEYQSQATLEYAFARNGAERPGFPSIVGSGIYSTVLHYNENRKKMEAGEVVVIDIGAEYSYYTADITRTYPVSGKFTARQREIYQLVLDAQRAAEKAFKPGQSSIAQLHKAAIDVMKASPLRDKQGNTLERYFIHGLGHWLGMDVHDVGTYGTIPVGAVFTIEPGIYIPEEKLGVRIEDDYLVTENGLLKMSARIPSEPDQIEQLMQNGLKVTSRQ
jgi:Xaa-Pro aminopeptidase